VFVDERIVRMCRDELDAVNLCIDLSRMSDETLCDRLGIDKGHWSRIRKGRAHFPTAKRIALMRLAGNWAPIQYELGISGVGRRLHDTWKAAQAQSQGAGQWQSFGAAA
jgi:transcriptional regulator with XRE-family HTH domain